MQTKGGLLIARGPPPGLSISPFLCLLRGTEAPSWALKAGVLCLKYIGALSWLPGEALEKGRRLTDKKTGRLERTLGRKETAQPPNRSRARGPAERVLGEDQGHGGRAE